MRNKQGILNEAARVKELGDQIGYGHLMSLASALWRDSLKTKGYPTSGAFVPTILQFIDKEGQKDALKTANHYDQLIKG